MRNSIHSKRDCPHSLGESGSRAATTRTCQTTARLAIQVIGDCCILHCRSRLVFSLDTDGATTEEREDLRGAIEVSHVNPLDIDIKRDRVALRVTGNIMRGCCYALSSTPVPCHTMLPRAR